MQRSESGDTLDRRRQVVTAVTFVATVSVNAAANALPINGQLTAQISDRFQVFVVPAGYVFSIWAVIYLGLAAFTIHQARPSRAADPILRSLGWLPALTGVLNTVWLLLFHFEVFALTVPVMVALLATLIAIHHRLWQHRDGLDRATRWLVSVPFSIYLGWITVATIANIAQALRALGFDGFGIQPELIASVVLVTGIAIAGTFVWRFHDVAYGLVIIWAYGGIVVKESASSLVPVVAAAGTAVIATLVVLVLLGRLPAPARTYWVWER
jgi:benzodiazapine receptor